MKALSIRQPWAWLILHAGKDIENRNWPTLVRGEILIHASKGMTRNEYLDAYDFALHVNPALKIPHFEDLPRGGIVGSAVISDCVKQSVSPWFFGKYGYVLHGATPVDFFPLRGRLGFFEVDITV